MEQFVHDIRYSLRSLRKNKGFTAVVLMTLAIGIGANTAIFSVVDAILLRPLPFPQPDRLVRVVDNLRGPGLRDIGMSVPEFQDLATRVGIFDEISVTWPVDANLTGGDRPERVELLAVSPNYFSLLGAQAQLGRVFGPQDRAQGFAEAALISDGLWHRLFGADRNVLGRQIRMDSDLYTIVGVMPPGFRHPGRTVATDVDVWGTAGFAANPFPKPSRNIRLLPGAIGRLKPGLPASQAQPRLDAFIAAVQREFPNDYRADAQWNVQLEPLQESLVGNVRPLLWVLLGAVSLMLAAACVNIANLLLARASGRQREIAVRQALGAARGRLVRQFLTESLVLSLLAGAIGITAASVGLRLLLAMMPSQLPRLHEIAIDWRVMLFALAVSLATGILFGLAPAFQLSAVSLTSRESGPSRAQSRVSAILVAAEFAIAMVLMIGAGLLVRSFWRLTTVDPGFNPRNVLAARTWIPVPNDPKADAYRPPEVRVRFAREVLRRARALPGVNIAAMTNSVPLGGNAFSNGFTIEDHPAVAVSAEAIAVTPEYFAALEIPIERGRVFLDGDAAGAPIVAVVDRSTERRFWPNASAMGKRFKNGGPQSAAPWITIVGVVGDVRHDGLTTSGVPHVYFSLYQRPDRVYSLLLRAAADPASLAQSARAVIQAVDANLPVFAIQALSRMEQASLGQQRFSAQLMTAFAALAMLLSGVGIYGVLAYSIGRRTREIGVRMALGARGGDITGMVLRQAMRMILSGAAIGLVAAMLFGRLLTGLLYGVGPADPTVVLTVPAILLAIAAAASYLPTLRATRIDPLVALRTE